MVEINQPTILIRISKAYVESLTERELYDYTRGYWVLSPERANKAKYGFAVYKGIVKEVYVVDEWFKAGATESTRLGNQGFDEDARETMHKRYEFVGCVASKHMRDKYVGMSVSSYFTKGNSNPIMYLNM